MAFHTQQSISGFFATSPQLSHTTNGDARFFARIGQEHFQRNDDSSFTELEPTFHTLILYRKTAEHAYEQFRKGDKFVAEGYVREYEYNVEGETRRGEQFIAKKIGHDTARTTYTIDRARGQAGQLTRPVNATGIETNQASREAAAPVSPSPEPTPPQDATSANPHQPVGPATAISHPSVAPPAHGAHAAQRPDLSL